MATIYFTASSIDGFIVDADDSLGWLLSRNIDAAGPFGYQAFSDSVGALVMGATTYEWIVANQPGEWMYSQPTWVMTHRPEIVKPGHPVHAYQGDITELQTRLLQAAGCDEMQGYLFSQPLPAADIGELVRLRHGSAVDVA